jgi:hypothetical protein
MQGMRSQYKTLAGIYIHRNENQTKTKQNQKKKKKKKKKRIAQSKSKRKETNTTKQNKQQFCIVSFCYVSFNLFVRLFLFVVFFFPGP